MKLDGKAIAENIYENLRERINVLQKRQVIPHLVVFLIGENPASVAYVTLKQKKGEEIGAKVTILNYPTSITTETLEEKVKLLNDDPYVHGILIQRPLPEHIDEKKLEQITNPEKDIDGFHPDSPYTLPLPLAVVKILEDIFQKQIDGDKPPTLKQWLQTQKIVLLGKGPTGGGPIIEHLKTLSVTPTIIDSKTKHPEKIFREADIVISAVGKQHVVRAEHLKPGVILISVGINRGGEGNKLHGDYDETSVESVASYYTPTPGGVGPVNVAMLMHNLLTAAEAQSQE